MSKYNTTIRNSWDIDGLSAELQALARERTRNSDLPDQYFIYSCNTTADVYTYGESAVDVPDTINDVATKPMLRQGAIAYLGPGVMGIFMVISLRKTQQPDVNFVFECDDGFKFGGILRWGKGAGFSNLRIDLK